MSAGCRQRAEEKPKVAVLVPSPLAHHAQIIRHAANNAAADIGGIVTVSVAQPGQEGRELQKLIQAGAQAVCVGLTGGLNLDEQIRGIVYSGVPIVLFNVDRPDSRRNGFLGGDERLAGQLLGRELIDVLDNPDASVVILTGPSDDPIQRRRLYACRDELDKKRLTIAATIDCQGDPDSAAEQLVQTMAGRTDIIGIASTGPWVCQDRVLQAIGGFNLKIAAIGNDQQSFKAVEQGKCHALIVHDIYTWVREGTEMCLRRLRGQIVQPPAPVAPIAVHPGDMGDLMKRWGKQAVTTSPSELKYQIVGQ